MNPFKHSAQNFFKRIEKDLINHRKYIFATAINLTALFIISVVLQALGILDIQRFVSLKLFAWSAIALDITALRVHQYTTKTTTSRKFFKYGFLALIIIQLIKNDIALGLFELVNVNLFALTFLFGIIVLYDNKHIIKEYEIEEQQDVLDEKKRRAMFAKKYPKINKIPILRSIVKWMYKEGWEYSSLLIVFILIGGVLRITNLDYFSIYHDEFFYTSSTKTFVETGGTNLWNYVTNSPSHTHYKPLITIFLGIFTKIFGYNTFNLRLPEAILGTLTIFVIYYVTKKITRNKKIAIIASVFLCFNEILIYLSRFIRQYAYFIIICLILTLIMYKLNSNIRNPISKKLIILYASSAFIVFVITFQQISPFVVTFAIPFIIYMIINLELSNYKHKTLLTSIICLTIVLIFLVDYYGLYEFINIKHILERNTDFTFDQKAANYYMSEIFASYKLSNTFMFYFGILSSMLLIAKTKWSGLFAVSLLWIPLLSTGYMPGDTDFRYCSFICHSLLLFLGLGFIMFLAIHLNYLK